MAEQVKELESTKGEARSAGAAESYVRELAPKADATTKGSASGGFRVPLPDAVSRKSLKSLPLPAIRLSDDVDKPSVTSESGELPAAVEPATPQEPELSELVRLAKEYEHPVPDPALAELWPRHETTESLLVEPLAASLDRAPTSALIAVEPPKPPPTPFVSAPVVEERRAVELGVTTSTDKSTSFVRSPRAWVALAAFVLGCVGAVALVSSLERGLVEPHASLESSERRGETVSSPASSAPIALPAVSERVASSEPRGPAAVAPSAAPGASNGELSPSAPSGVAAAASAVSFEDLPAEGEAVRTASAGGRDDEVKMRAASASGSGTSAASQAKSEAREKPAATHAVLAVNSIPVSEVFVDGKKVGRTPRSSLKVEPGRHNVLLVHPKHGRRAVSVQLKPGQRRVVSIKF